MLQLYAYLSVAFNVGQDIGTEGARMRIASLADAKDQSMSLPDPPWIDVDDKG